MESLDVSFEPATVEYDVTDQGKTTETIPVRSKEEIAEEILKKRAEEFHAVARQIKLQTRHAMLGQERQARKTRNRKRNKMAKASRKRNRR